MEVRARPQSMVMGRATPQRGNHRHRAPVSHEVTLRRVTNRGSCRADALCHERRCQQRHPSYSYATDGPGKFCCGDEHVPLVTPTGRPWLIVSWLPLRVTYAVGPEDVGQGVGVWRGGRGADSALLTWYERQHWLRYAKSVRDGTTAGHQTPLRQTTLFST